MGKVDVIVTLYVPTRETLALARRCILSVLLRTDSPFRLILVDDCSPLDEIRTFVRQVARRFSSRDIVTLFNEANLGFVKTANRAMEYGDPQGYDVVLLNNDTEVTQGWLASMVAVAYRHRRIATVTPMSNNATIASFPVMHAENVLPPGYSVPDMGRLLRRWSPGAAPEIPTGHGFCLFIKRSVLREVGVFDAVAFGKGYGEENDFCCRCLERGYYHALDDTTFVYHKGEASFQGSRAAVTGTAFETLIHRYPFFKSVIVAFEGQDPLRAMRQALGREMQLPPLPKSEPAPPQPTRVLFLNFAGGPFNGLRRYTEDLIRGLGATARVFVLESDGIDMALRDGLGLQLYYTRLEQKLNWNNVYTNLAYRRVLSYVVEQLHIQLIQVNSFEGHTFDVMDVAEELGIPVLYVSHDFELVCPTHFLVGPGGTLCRMCGHGDEEEGCLERNPYLVSGSGSTAQLSRYRDFVSREVIARLSMAVCPSYSAQERLIRAYSAIAPKTVVIPHGVPDRQERTITKPSRSGTLRVATVGALHELKGQELLRDTARQLPAGAFEFHHFGTSGDRIERVIYHGPYQAAMLPDLLEESGIDVVLMLSLLPETFGYTLSEVALARIPVVALDVGAVAERVRASSLGWVVPYDDPRAVVETLTRLASNRALLENAGRWMRVNDVARLREMSARYVSIYGRVATKQERAGVRPGFEEFLRVTAHPNQVRIDELVAAMGRLEGQVRDLRLQNEILTGSLPVRIARMIHRIPGMGAVLRQARSRLRA